MTKAATDVLAERGRQPSDLREPLTPDSDPNPRLARVNEEGP